MSMIPHLSLSCLWPLIGMGQGQAEQWMHVLLPALLATLCAIGDAPARSLTALA
jgi:hypothetical protein